MYNSVVSGSSSSSRRIIQYLGLYLNNIYFKIMMQMLHNINNNNGFTLLSQIANGVRFLLQLLRLLLVGSWILPAVWLLVLVLVNLTYRSFVLHLLHSSILLYCWVLTPDAGGWVYSRNHIIFLMQTISPRWWWCFRYCSSCRRRTGQRPPRYLLECNLMFPIITTLPKTEQKHNHHHQHPPV